MKVDRDFRRNLDAACGFVERLGDPSAMISLAVSTRAELDAIAAVMGSEVFASVHAGDRPARVIEGTEGLVEGVRWYVQVFPPRAATPEEAARIPPGGAGAALDRQAPAVTLVEPDVLYTEPHGG